MRVWSSANFFTSRTNDVLSYCTQDVKNKRDECGIIDTYFRNYFRCRGEQLDTAPLHDLDRHFIKLFEKFVRLDDNTTRTTRGTGLGLFIVKGLVEAMNGSIKLHSDKDCGFCVEVTLNLANVQEPVK